MKLRVLAIVLLLLAPLAGAAEMTAAWSVPLDYVAPSRLSWGNIPKLGKPPGESAFFQPGDELWDLSWGFMGERLPENGGFDDPGDLRGYRKWPGEWLVWNARSGMLVARGSETDILMTEEVMNFANLPVTLRAKLELSSGSAGKLRTVALGAQSGNKATAEGEGLEMEVTLLDPGHSGEGDAALKASWEINSEPWSLETAFTVHYGERTRIAAHGTGEERWELFATITREFFHGVPVSASRWRESKQGIEPWLLGGESERLEPNVDDDSLVFGIYRVPADLLARLGPGGGEGAAQDPSGPAEDRPVPTVGAPRLAGEWEGWLHGEFLDLRTALKEKGMIFEPEGSYAIFNSRTCHVLVSATSINQDLCETLISGVGCYIRSDVWVSSNAESGAWGLTARSGETAKLKSRREGRNMSFEIEPSLEDAFFTGLRYEFDNRAESGGGISIDAASKFLMGCPQTIGSHQASGREEQKVVLTACYLYD